MNIFITGIAGMIGMHTAKKLASEGHHVIGIDNYNNYYDVTLKIDRAHLIDDLGVKTHFGDLCKPEDWSDLLKGIDVVLHLGGYAGVRDSLEKPNDYINANITGTQCLIQECEKHGIENVLYASTSCVMHGQETPWNEDGLLHHPNNPYGWSKLVNECQFKHSKIPRSSGLRFFTVYGPYGRPDMALFSFCDALVKNESIDLFNYGDMKRDFTFVEDIVQGIELIINKISTDLNNYSDIYNIGYGEQVQLTDFVDEIEKQFGRPVKRNLVPMHPADTPATWSDTTKLQKLGYKPKTPISVGVAKFVEWYKSYYKVN
jgi:UDP-glucuronate 4-epimerase